MNRRAIIIISIGALLVTAAAVGFSWWVLRPLVPLDGKAVLSGLQQNVAVNFDDRAVPYIEGRSDEDVYQAQGYITARDRLFQMDILRRLAYGRMSEVFGSPWLPSDRLMETLGISTLAYAELGKLTPAAKAALESYARGVNEYISQYSARLPHEFQVLGYTPATWSAQDSLAILKYAAYEIDESWRLDDFRQRVTNHIGAKKAGELFNDNLVAYGLPSSPVVPAVPPAQSQPSKPGTTGNTSWQIDAPAGSAGLDRLLAALPETGNMFTAHAASGACLGSSTWAVPGSATESHGAMLACDKDGILTYPCRWYLCSLNSQTMHVAGASMPGVPSIMVGRNEAIAFGSSALKADVQDIYLEKFKSQFDTAYQTPAGWLEATVETRGIPVRLAGDVEHKVITTEHGPLLLRSGNMAVSLAWTGFDTDHPSYQALYDLNYAADTASALKALHNYSDPPMMFVLADREGNISCQAAGLIPLRSGGTQGTLLNPGWQSAGSWLSYVPFEKLPYASVDSRDAKMTPLVAANQKPEANAAFNAPPVYPADIMLGHQFDPPYRANRLLTLLSQRKNPVSLADMVALSADEYSPLASLVAKSLKSSLLSQHIIDRNSLQAAESLDKWDGQLQPSSTEAGIYESFLQTAARRLVEPALGRKLATEYLQRYPQWISLVQSVIENQPAGWLPPDERTFPTFVTTTLTQSLKALRITFNTSNVAQWPWGDIHLASFAAVAPALPQSLTMNAGLPSVKLGGAPECINSFSVSCDPSAVNYEATSGPQQRLIVDMSDHDKFYQAISSGQSGCFLSPHHADQLKSWAAVDYMPIAFSSDQLIRQSKHRLMLEPD
jgi:penicillin amidase